MIKLKSYRIAILGIIFVVIGYLILPSIQLPQLDSFNHEKRNKAPLHDFIEFKDDMVIDGDLFKSIAQQKSKTYQVYYTIKSKEEKEKIL
ncbi:DNA internalization-related competence protein ComEC/Rec2, partial [Mammaliicoccus lentus]|nr:DNA internalization-related competence protein ComEC/Rec2 [Mammaliicoccus lentus]